MGNVPTKEPRRPPRPPRLAGLRPARKDDKLKARERQMLDLVVDHTENIDGGYFAPFGTYKSNLDFSTTVVRGLIAERKLAPFYTPLQDYSAEWSDTEILVLARQLPLHAIGAAYSEEEDDADSHKLHRLQNAARRQETKRRLQQAAARVQEVQRAKERAYEEAKAHGDAHVPLDELVLALYRHPVECPICFLYFPQLLNTSRCCGQPICTECFVQIRRLEPHPPHDHDTATGELPPTLISEYASCPYCAVPNFGVLYEPNPLFRTGDGVAPAAYRRPQGEPRRRRPRRFLTAADAPGVVTTDHIRPDWQQKLESAIGKLARKAATASAIHALNLLVEDNRGDFLQTLEDRMIEEAMRLSLLDRERSG